MNKDQLKKLLHYHVRLSPRALRGDGTGRLLPFDDDWSMEEITDSYIKIQNTLTRHAPLLGLDQIRSYTSDPQRNQHGFKYGFLSLHVQLTIQSREVLIDLLERPDYTKTSRAALGKNEQQSTEPTFSRYWRSPRERVRDAERRGNR